MEEVGTKKKSLLISFFTSVTEDLRFYSTHEIKHPPSERPADYGVGNWWLLKANSKLLSLCTEFVIRAAWVEPEETGVHDGRLPSSPV